MKLRFTIVSKNGEFQLGPDAFKNAEGFEFETDFVANNTRPISKVYNDVLDETRKKSDVDFQVFMHSDVNLDVLGLAGHLKQVQEKYDLIGLCGTQVMNISQTPLNWFTSSRPCPNARWGCVTHGELGGMTSFFNEDRPDTDHEVACIDGLCIAFGKNALRSEIKFDETLSDFDMYDTDISTQAMIKYRLRIGVVVRRDLKHFSIGKSILDEKFLESELRFRLKWNFPLTPPLVGLMEKRSGKEQQKTA